MVVETQPPDWADKVLELLKTQRQQQRWLAAMIGVSETYMTRLLNGERPAKPDHIAKIASALGVPVHWIDDTTKEHGDASA